MIEIDCVTREGVTVTRCVDAPSAEFLGLLIGKIPTIALVKDTIRKGTSRAYGEKVPFKTSSVRVDVENCRALGRESAGWLRDRTVNALSYPIHKSSFPY
jgi:hypothetical protein